jgi:hypothetical protein
MKMNGPAMVAPFRHEATASGESIEQDEYGHKSAGTKFQGEGGVSHVGTPRSPLNFSTRRRREHWESRSASGKGVWVNARGWGRVV